MGHGLSGFRNVSTVGAVSAQITETDATTMRIAQKGYHGNPGEPNQRCQECHEHADGTGPDRATEQSESRQKAGAPTIK